MPLRLNGSTSGYIEITAPAVADNSSIDLVGALAAKANNDIAVNAQTGTTYALVAADDGKLVTLNNAAAIQLQVNSGVIPAGGMVALAQLGAGQVTIVAGSGVTINSDGAKMKLKGQYAAGQLYCLASNSFLLVGNLAA